MNITKQKQTDRECKPVVTSGEREGGEGQNRGRGLRGTTTMYKINKLQGHIVQHGECSQYFIITLNGI